MISLSRNMRENRFPVRYYSTPIIVVRHIRTRVPNKLKEMVNLWSFRLEAYMGVSDDEVIEATAMDRCWQLVLDCIDTEEAPFSKGTLVAFRRRLIEGQIDRRLIERTIEIASQSQTFGSRALRAALDSSPLWGAGRVEDTYNLVGHALKR